VIDASSTQHVIFHVCQTDATWQHITYDLTPYAGTTVTLEFLVHGDGFGDRTDMNVDDVTVQTPIVVTTNPTITSTASSVTFNNTVDSGPTPGSNVIVNPGFETSDFTGWATGTTGTEGTPVVQNATVHNGTFAAMLGDGSTFTGTEGNGDAFITQSVAVPSGTPSLDFWVKRGTSDTITFDWQDMYVIDASSTQHVIFHVCQTDATWQHITTDMTPYAGTTVTIEFLVHEDGFGDQTDMFVDDVNMTGQGPGFNLTVNAATSTTFGGAVGSSAPINVLTNNTATATGGAITTTAGLVMNDSGVASITGVISGGALTKNGLGTLTVTGASSVAGSLTAGTLLDDGTLGNVSVSSGVLGGTGISGADVFTGGSMSPGDPTTSTNTTFAVTSVDLSGGGNYRANISAGLNGDLTTASGAITLGGTSTLTLDLNTLVTTGGPVTIMTGGSVTGTFSSVNLVNNPNGYTASVTYTATQVKVTINAGGPAPFVVSQIVNGGAPQYVDQNGVSLSLVGQNSVVEQMLVTFNEPVTLDAGVFSVTDFSPVTVFSGASPNTLPIGINAMVPVGGGPAATQWIVTFNGTGTNALTGGGIGHIVKDGVYNFNVDGSKVHANSQTAVNNTRVFWAMYGATHDNVLSANPGDGNSEIFLDGNDFIEFKNAFNSLGDSTFAIPGYDVRMDYDLDGYYDGGTFVAFRTSFNSLKDWAF
jgi:hypothetical protein